MEILPDLDRHLRDLWRAALVPGLSRGYARQGLSARVAMKRGMNFDRAHSGQPSS